MGRRELWVQTMQSNGHTRRKRVQGNVSIMTTNEKYARVNIRKRGKRNGHARISAGGNNAFGKMEMEIGYIL